MHCDVPNDRSTNTRQVNDGDAVCRCCCKWYFIDYVGKFGDLLVYAFLAVAVVLLCMLHVLQNPLKSTK